jgi:hypothetical protein
VEWLGSSDLDNTVFPPTHGLRSNSNYILYNDCKPLIGLAVTIHVTQDIVCQSASGPIVGCSFQLNGYSPKNHRCALQQYLIELYNNKLYGAVNNWPVSAVNNWTVSDHYIIDDIFPLTVMPDAKLRAGYQLNISLQNDDSGNVIGATYVVIDGQGHIWEMPRPLSEVAPADLAPIIAFELNLVGPSKGEWVLFASGGGTIVYTSASPLTVLNCEPECVETGAVTNETSNASYGRLFAGPSTMIVQWFNMNAARPVLSAAGRRRPSLVSTPEHLRLKSAPSPRPRSVRRQ